VEPGNPVTNSLPTFPPDLSGGAMVVKMINGARPLGMYQIAENEFLLVYDRGGCFVTKCEWISMQGRY
jgi:hypothetical protein